jgi:hypothetical protein
MKKSQVTIFIIIGIVLIGIIVLALFLRGKTPVEPIPQDFLPVYNLVQECLVETGENSLLELGQTAGSNFDLYNVSNIRSGYYFFEGKSYLPTKQELADTISEKIKYSLYTCVNSFEELQDFQVVEEDINVKTSIEDEKVILELDYPLTVSKNGKTTQLEKFNTEILIRLGIIYKVIAEINQEQLENPQAICVNCFQQLAEQNDLNIEVFEYDETTILFMIRDGNSKIKEEDFVWVFAHELKI